MKLTTVIFMTILGSLIPFTSAQNSCLICNSDTNPNCATLNNEGSLISSCSAEEENYCFIQMDENGHIERGCSGASFCQESQYCNVCQGSNCNNGAYPAGRLQCHKCSGIDCANPLTGPVEICNIYKSDDTCYTVVVTDEGDETHTHRGCSSDVSNFCENYPDICVTCTGNGCNNQPPRGTSELSCIKCTEPDPACRYEYEEESGQMCGYEVFLGRPERCYTHVDTDGQVRRGCLDDFRTEQQIVNECDGTNERCTICTTDNCNWEQIAKPTECAVCSSVIEPNCALLSTTPNLEECPTGSHDKRGCFLMHTNSVVSRGCVSALDTVSLETCKAGEECKICLDDGCNRKVDFQTCFTCNSNEDQECISAQTNEDPRTCLLYTDSCISFIEAESKRTVRGCQAETILPPGVSCPSDTCSICSEASCNSPVFPDGRRSCNRCYSTAECENDLTVNTAFQSVCEFYDTADQCYSVVVADNIHRGCMSDGSPGVQHCQEAGDKCLVCSGQYCNSVAAYRVASMQCIKCSDEDPACEWAYATTSATVCEGNVGLGEDESCYIIHDADGNTIRGCTLEDPSMCEAEDTDCEICLGNGCNNKGMTRQICIQCRSDVDDGEHCAEHPEGINATACEETEITYDKRGCYIEVLPDGAVKRGCAIELSADQLEHCKSEDEEKNCHYCEGSGCNDKPGGSSVVAISYINVLASLLFIVLVSRH